MAAIPKLFEIYLIKKYGINRITKDIVIINPNVSIPMFQSIRENNANILSYIGMGSNTSDTKQINYQIFASMEYSNIIKSKIPNVLDTKIGKTKFTALANCENCEDFSGVEIIYLCNQYLQFHNPKPKPDQSCLKEFDLNGDNIIWRGMYWVSVPRRGLISHIYGSNYERLVHNSLWENDISTIKYNPTISGGRYNGNSRFVEISGQLSVQNRLTGLLPVEIDKHRFDEEVFSFFYPLNNDDSLKNRKSFCIIVKGNNEDLETILRKTELCLKYSANHQLSYLDSIKIFINDNTANWIRN